MAAVVPGATCLFRQPPVKGCDGEMFVPSMPLADSCDRISLDDYIRLSTFESPVYSPLIRGGMERMMTDFSVQLEKLLAEKQHHTAALHRIDETLEKVGSLLGLNTHASVRRGRPPKAAPAATPVAVKAAAPQKHKGKRRWFSVTAEQSILDFISKSSSPSTKEVNRHWKAEGRGGTADNTLSLMVKKRAIKRVPIEGQHGSRYVLA
jgi:hypothetical protein